MAPKTFENRLCGLSLDMFNKDYVHENLWDVEHTDAEKRVNFKNNLKLSKNGDMLGSTLFKGDCGVVHAELMLQNAGNNHVEASAVVGGAGCRSSRPLMYIVCRRWARYAML